MYVNSLCELCLIAEHTENLSLRSWNYTGGKWKGKTYIITSVFNETYVICFYKFWIYNGL